MRKNPSDTAGVFNVQWHLSFKVTKLSGYFPFWTRQFRNKSHQWSLFREEGGSRRWWGKKHEICKFQEKEGNLVSTVFLQHMHSVPITGSIAG